MIWFSNLIFYFLYRFQLIIQAIFTYPVRKFLQNRRVIEAYRKRGVKDPEKEVLKALNDPKNGTNSLIASVHTVMLLFLWIVGPLNILLHLLGLGVYLSRLHYLVILAIAYWIDHLIFYRNERYLIYFKQFDQMNKNKKILFGWMAFSVVLGTWIFGMWCWLTLDGIKPHPERWGIIPTIDW